MQELDKSAMGQRIRQIRSRAGLRQWELARLLGTTQSAVHKYEHGVVPEPRRLIELARIGDTTVEWILTGHHWENGSQHQERLDADVLRIASALRELSDAERDAVDHALQVLRQAVDAVSGSEAPPSAEATRAGLREHAAGALGVLEAAYRIQCAVMSWALGEASARLETPSTPDEIRRRGDSPLH